MALRIQFFVQFAHEQGTYFRFHNLAIALKELGHHVSVFACDHDTRSKARTELRDGICYAIVPSSRGTTIVSPFCHPVNAVKRWLLSYPPCDVAHLFQPFPNAALPWLRCKARMRFYDWDDLWAGGLISATSTDFRVVFDRVITRFWEKRLPAKATHVTVCSQFLSDLARDRGAKRASVVHNGLWPYEPLPKLEARKALNLSPTAIYVGFMGKTCNELDWCYDSISENLHRWKNLRLALCGVPENLVKCQPERIRRQIDHLGQLPPMATREFSSALDIGLLPLEDSAFNRSRFPIKFAEYMASGTPVLASEVGDCSALSRHFPWVIKAGRTKDEWLAAFRDAVNQIQAGTVSPVDPVAVEAVFSWHRIGAKLLSLYENEPALRAQTAAAA
jgi:glycosyltransferase involved in cell wall biosynthesis